MSSVRKKAKRLRKRVNYWDTRWGKREAARRLIRQAMAAMAIASGISIICQIRASYADPKEKALALASAVVATHNSVAKAWNSV